MEGIQVQNTLIIFNNGICIANLILVQLIEIKFKGTSEKPRLIPRPYQKAGWWLLVHSLVLTLVSAPGGLSHLQASLVSEHSSCSKSRYVLLLDMGFVWGIQNKWFCILSSPCKICVLNKPFLSLLTSHWLRLVCSLAHQQRVVWQFPLW